MVVKILEIGDVKVYGESKNEPQLQIIKSIIQNAFVKKPLPEKENEQ